MLELSIPNHDNIPKEEDAFCLYLMTPIARKDNSLFETKRSAVCSYQPWFTEYSSVQIKKQ